MLLSAVLLSFSHKRRLISSDRILIAKGVRTNRVYSFYGRAGDHLPPYFCYVLFVFGSSKPPPYKVAAD